MSKTSLKQKILLIGFGFFITVALLEISLRIAGALVLQLQEKHNHLSADKNEYRILCLGESTTALGGEDSYPSQLEKMLNEGHSKKFTVINKGVISTTTDVILAHADQNLDRYKPQLVIVMMGINDYYYPRPTKMPLWLWKLNLACRDLRVYKLVRLLYLHITHRIGELANPNSSEDVNKSADDYQQTENLLKYLFTKETQEFQARIAKVQELIQKNQQEESKLEFAQAQKAIVTASFAAADLAHRYIQEGLFQEAQSYLDKAAVFNPKASYVYQGYGELYLAQEKTEDSIKAYQVAFAMDPNNFELLIGLARAYHQQHNQEAYTLYAKYLQLNPKDYWRYLEFAQWLRSDKLFDQASIFLDMAIKSEPTFDQAYLDQAQILDEQGRFKQEEEFLLEKISKTPRNFRFLQALGQLYEKQGKDDLAKQYFKKAVANGMSQYSPWTWSNYNLLLNKIRGRGIKVIVMQYPVRSIDPIKDYLGQREGVVYVENRQNFKQALAQGSFKDYFSDNFAYDFGHCTRRGNQLIVKNLAPVVLKTVQ